MVHLGPATPFVGIATLGIVAACVVVGAALLSGRRSSVRMQLNSRHKNAVIILLVAITFVLWGASTGHGGPHADGGTIGYTHGGVLRYISVISYQAPAGGAWSHDVTVRPLALIGTIGLNASAVIVTLYGCRRICGRPDRARATVAGDVYPT